MKVNLQLYQ